MGADPFEHFGDQMSSWESLEQHAPALLAKARRILATDPTADLVGVVLAPDAHEARMIVAHLERSVGHERSEPIVEVVRRAEVVRVLRTNATASLEWLPPRDASGSTLVLACFTKRGVRFGATTMTPNPTGGRPRVSLARLTPEQTRIGEAIRSCAAHLADIAKQTLHDHPDIDPVGVIVEPGSPHRAALIAASGASPGAEPVAEGIVTLMRRAEVIEVLRAALPALANGLPARAPEERILPVVLFAVDAVCMAMIAIP